MSKEMAYELDYNEIGRNICYYRKRAGLTQGALANAINVTPQHVSHIEHGVRLSLETLVCIAVYLKVDINNLLGDNVPRLSSDTRTVLKAIAQNASSDDIEKLLTIWSIIEDKK